MGELEAGMKTAELLKTYGSWGLVVVLLAAIAWLAKKFLEHLTSNAAKVEKIQIDNAAKVEKIQTDHANELKRLHDECAAALQSSGAENRKSEEAKNERIIGFATRFSEVVTENTNALERYTDAMNRTIGR